MVYVQSLSGLRTHPVLRTPGQRQDKKPYKRWQFFKNIIPSYNLKIDPDSYHFYQAEDWEMLLLQTGQSPFSRRKVKETEDDAEDEDFGL